MGMILAKRAEEQSEYDTQRIRAEEILENCRPEYLKDPHDPDNGRQLLEVLGLVPGDAFNDFDVEEEEEEEEDEEEGDKEEKAAAEEDKGATRIRKKAQLMIVRDKTSLLRHSAKGNWIMVQQTLGKQHVNIDHKDKYGRSALYLASERGHAGVVDVLLQNHAAIETTTKEGWTPLHAACFNGQVSVITKLMEKSANTNAREKNGCTPLAIAASSPKLFLVDLVSKADRQKRKAARKGVFKKQQQMDAAQAAREGQRGSSSALSRSGVRAQDPYTMYKFYPNRIELIVMEKLLRKVNVIVDQGDNKRRTPLIYAAQSGRTAAVSRLLNARASLRHEDMDCRSPLFHAASNGHVEVVDMLIECQATINSTDCFIRTPLHAALDENDEGMCNLLLKADASVNAFDCEGRTPIMLAMDKANRRLFADLIQRRSNLDVRDKRGWNVVIYAIETGMFSEVLPLLTKLGHRACEIIRNTDPQGRNALHHAVQLRDLEAANRVLRPLCQLDPDAAAAQDCNGDTPVHVACELGRLESLRLLVERFVSAEMPNNRGETPLHVAAHGGQLACVVALLHDAGTGAKCDATAVDVHQKTLLMHACESGHLDLVNLLLQNREGVHTELAIKKFDVNQEDAEGCTALMYAAREGHWQLLPSLVLAGANIAAKDRDGFSALHWASVEDEGLVVNCLLDLGLDINATDATGWTPLMHAVGNGSDEATRLLVDNGADLHMRNWDGDTALQICTRRQDAGARSSRDILTDGILNRDTTTSLAVPAQGHFMISVISAMNLSLEGTAGDVNSYVCLQFCPRADTIPQIAFTSCSLKNPCPEWHEVFRFDTNAIDPTAYLVAWVMAAPGDDPEEIVEATALGVSEKELRKIKSEAKSRGIDLSRTLKPKFTSSLEESFSRVKRRADENEDKDVNRLRTLETAKQLGVAPTEDLVNKADRRDVVPLSERRWTEVNNLRQLLKKAGCDIPKPLAPEAHLPLGCVIMRFRHLREAVWGCEPVQMNRMVRLSARGSLKIEIDFRPKYFVPVDPGPKLATAEEEEIYEVGAGEDTSAVHELAALGAITKNLAQLGPVEENPIDDRRIEDDETRILLGPIVKQDPQTLYKRFMQVAYYSHKALKAKENLGGGDFEGRLSRAMADQSAKARSVSIATVASKAVGRIRKDYIENREYKKLMNLLADKPFEDPYKEPPPSSAAAKKPETKQEQKLKAMDKKGGPANVATEPWLEEVLDGSRFY